MSASDNSLISNGTLQHAYSQAMIDSSLEDLKFLDESRANSVVLEKPSQPLPGCGELQEKDLFCDEGLNTPYLYMQIESHACAKLDATESIKSRLSVKHDSSGSNFSTETTSIPQKPGKTILQVIISHNLDHLMVRFETLLAHDHF